MFHIEIWSKTYILLQYEENLRGQFLGNSPFLNTIFWPKTGFFLPRDWNFGTKFQKHSVISYLGPKKFIPGQKIVPCGNWKNWVLQTPQKPPGAPWAPQGGPGGQKWPKSSLISPVMRFHAKKSNFKGVGFFSVFFTRNDPARKPPKPKMAQIINN